MAYVRAFDDAEFDRRRSEVRRPQWETPALICWVCQDPANMNWLTGFDGWSFYMPQAVLVHRDEEGSDLVRARAGRQVGVDHDQPSTRQRRRVLGTTGPSPDPPSVRRAVRSRQATRLGGRPGRRRLRFPPTTLRGRTGTSSPDSQTPPSRTTGSWSTGRVWSSRKPSLPTCAKRASSRPGS